MISDYISRIKNQLCEANSIAVVIYSRDISVKITVTEVLAILKLQTAFL